MLYILVTFIVGISVLMLGVKVFFIKDGKFPNFHVGNNEALRKHRIGCVQSQDYEARYKHVFSIDEIESVLDNKNN